MCTAFPGPLSACWEVLLSGGPLQARPTRRNNSAIGAGHDAPCGSVGVVNSHTHRAIRGGQNIPRSEFLDRPSSPCPQPELVPSRRRDHPAVSAVSPPSPTPSRTNVSTSWIGREEPTSVSGCHPARMSARRGACPRRSRSRFRGHRSPVRIPAPWLPASPMPVNS